MFDAERGKNMKNELSKEYLIMRDIICKYHPIYKGNRRALKNPSHYNVERLVEETMALVGKRYKYIDAAHCDFSDGTDSKTSSIRYDRKNNTCTGLIGNVVSPGGTKKKGALRLVIYNAFTKELMYYFIPKKAWSKMNISIHPTTKMGRLFYCYNRRTNSITKFEGYECKDFVDLAKRKN